MAREHGGILVGFRDGIDLCVEDILEVADSTAGRTSYLRRERPARKALQRYLERNNPEDQVGYVGEWHTHPAPIPPSHVDEQTMRTMARRNRRQVALVVASLGTDRKSVDLHALVSLPQTRRSRIAGRAAAAEVVVG